MDNKNSEIVVDLDYELILLHQRPELMQECCKLLNSEWTRSETARLRSLSMSCDVFPTSLVLLTKGKLIGHCKVSLIPNHPDSCIIESFIIHADHRSQGLGSMFLRAVENYVYNNGIKKVYLTTKGQEGFYKKNGYSIHNYSQSGNSVQSSNEKNVNSKKQENLSNGPPPPPLPTHLPVPNLQVIIASRTLMGRHL